MTEVASVGVCLSDLLERKCMDGVGDGDGDYVPVMEAGRVGNGLLLVYLVETQVGL